MKDRPETIFADGKIRDRRTSNPGTRNPATVKVTLMQPYLIVSLRRVFP
jgi:hypothetical protein